MAGVLLLFLSFLLLMPPPATATGELCGNGGNYTANSTYQSNLAALAATLPTNASASPELFAQATVGDAPDTVHALALCRGDIVNTTACKDCIAASFQEAQQACPYSKGAQLSCLLGFSGDDGSLGPAASGITDNSTLFQSWNQEIVTGDAGVVADGVHALLNGTATYAATTQSRFATVVMDSVNSPIPALYSLAQCTPDLSAGDCLACLQHLVGMVNATTSVLKGGRILVLRCNIRFELFQFYNGLPLQRMSPLSIAPASPVRAPSTVKRIGYMAPEYAYQGLCSLKSDVFSFGVLTLEIVSGKKNSGGNQYGDFINLLGYAWKLFEEGRWIELVDTSLLPSHHCTEMMRCINVALLCLQEKASDRPTMPDVVAMLGRQDYDPA
ncbi:hypothetical protein ACQ4PT_061437 [Festuca glaucescens]